MAGLFIGLSSIGGKLRPPMAKTGKFLGNWQMTARETLNRISKPLAGAFLIASGLACLGGFFGHFAAQRTGPLPSADNLPNGRPAFYYAEIADRTLQSRQPDFDLVRRANALVLHQTPADVSTWNRIAYAELAENRHMTREGLAAFYKSFALAPYGDLELMTWRLDFAAANWTSLPDDLQDKALAQIPVIAKFGTSWPWRIRNCKYNPHPEIYEAICAISPGVVRPENDS